MTQEDYDEIAKALTALVSNRVEFTRDEQEEVLHFVRVGEYGLALETAFHIALEEDRCLSLYTKRHVRQLAEMMDITHSVNVDLLRCDCS